jgi:hypothetical protein
MHINSVWNAAASSGEALLHDASEDALPARELELLS